ncbi:hypothetical protein [Rhodococcus sp. 14-2470-1b]|uniref:hypothetical protein n=1 Tax=Rhodococcus sp. 14-2470-1b TaxID=2023149 RepID=UPI00113FD8BF|nr:hypothetical protein [Rhodococcus sp. 14-2470-1b]
MQRPGLDPQQARAFIYETNATRNTLACALRLLSTDALTENTRDPIMVLLSAGLERLHKLTLGVIAIDDTGHWGNSKSHGHRVEEMHHRLLADIDRRAADRPHVKALVKATRSDLVLPAIINCADSFAREGRYSYLDALATTQTRATNPETAWRAIEDAASMYRDAAEQQIQAGQAPSDNQKWSAARMTRNVAITRSVTTLWDLVAAGGEDGLYGELGRILSSEINRRNVGRQV